MPVDLYVSKDFNTGKPILVFLFSKSDTKDAYTEWLENKPQKGDN